MTLIVTLNIILVTGVVAAIVGGLAYSIIGSPASFRRPREKPRQVTVIASAAPSATLWRPRSRLPSR